MGSLSWPRLMEAKQTPVGNQGVSGWKSLARGAHNGYRSKGPRQPLTAGCRCAQLCPGGFVFMLLPAPSPGTASAPDRGLSPGGFAWGLAPAPRPRPRSSETTVAVARTGEGERVRLTAKGKAEARGSEKPLPVSWWGTGLPRAVRSAWGHRGAGSVCGAVMDFRALLFKSFPAASVAQAAWTEPRMVFCTVAITIVALNDLAQLREIPTSEAGVRARAMPPHPQLWAHLSHSCSIPANGTAGL